MSTAKITLEKAYARLAAKELVADTAEGPDHPVAAKLDISALRIDESYDADCDPYNNTGQHLVAAVKRKYGE